MKTMIAFAPTTAAPGGKTHVMKSAATPRLYCGKMPWEELPAEDAVVSSVALSINETVAVATCPACTAAFKTAMGLAA